MVNGEWCEDSIKIKEETFEFFNSIFSKPDFERPIMSNGFKSLENFDRDLLESQVSDEEIWEAVKDCGSTKASGPDGFNFGFIKKYWSILKNDLVKAVEYFWESGCITNGRNSSFVTLIPKVKDTMGLGDFRPISHIGCYYKVISKVLVGRIKKALDKIIGQSQNAFLLG